MGELRWLGCVAGVLGGAGWIAAPFLSGDTADWVEYAGIALMSVMWFVVGLLTASGSLLWLRAIVGVGVVALVWSLIYAVRGQVDEDWVVIAFGAVGVLSGALVPTLNRGSNHHHGAHAR